MIINGNLKFHTAGAGELVNATMERLSTSARESISSPTAGRLIYNNTTNTYNFYDGTQWVVFATGGDATALQNEVNAIETASGNIFDGNGDYDSGVVDAALGNVTTSTDLLNALTQLDSAISAAAGVDTLAELTDVTVTEAVTNDMMVFTGSVWEDRTPVQVQTHLSLVPGTDVQAYDADLATFSDLSHVNGDVLYSNAGTWAIAQPGTTSGVQAWDSGLDSISGLTTAADLMVYTTAADTYATTSLTTYARTLLDDTNATEARATLGTIIGTDVQAWDVDLDEIAAIDNVSGNVLFTNGSNNWAAAAPGAVSGVQSWDTNLDEIAALSALDSTFIVGDGGSWVAESGATVRTSLDVYSTTDANNTFVDVAGDTMSGNLNLGGNQIVSLGAPTTGTDAANKSYVDAKVAGLTWKNSAIAATTANINLATGGLLTIDGVVTSADDRVLVKNQTAPAENGVYVVVDGTWTRATDFDSVSTPDEINSAAIFVEQGTTQQDTGWTVTSDVASLGSDTITFTQFNGAAGINDGIGLVKSGNTLDINMGAGIVALPSDEVGIDLYDSATGALILTEDGSARSILTGSALHLLLDGTTLSQSITGLKVPSQGITETELHTSIAGAGLAGGAGTALSVVVDNSSIEISGDTLQVKAAGVTNAMLANSTLTVSADSGTSDVVALGETFSLLGGTLTSTTVDAATNKVTIDVALSASDLGDVDTTGAVTDDVLVWNGANWVPGNPINSSSELTDVTAAATTAGEMLVSDGTNYTPSQIHYVHDGASASTTHTVAHSLGQQYVNVTVVDSSNSVIIPQSITMDNANQVTVTFNTSIACKVIVTGVAGV